MEGKAFWRCWEGPSFQHHFPQPHTVGTQQCQCQRQRKGVPRQWQENQVTPPTLTTHLTGTESLGCGPKSDQPGQPALPGPPPPPALPEGHTDPRGSAIPGKAPRLPASKQPRQPGAKETIAAAPLPTLLGAMPTSVTFLHVTPCWWPTHTHSHWSLSPLLGCRSS